jgi:hypothetical protein
MVDKHNESLLVMPTAFKNNGYAAMITDAPFVNYQWVADNTLFRERGIEARNLIGNYSARFMREKLPFMRDYGADAILKRDFLLFSVLTALPVPLKNAVYDDGKYWNSALLSINTLSLDSYALMTPRGIHSRLWLTTLRMSLRCSNFPTTPSVPTSTRKKIPYSENPTITIIIT